MQSRTKVEIKFEPDDEGRPIRRFRVELHTTKQSRRKDTERWYDDTTAPDWHLREVLATLDREAFGELLQSGVDWLTYAGEED